jgi:hypothetical protein
MTIIDLLKKIEQQIQFLGNTIKIPGMDRSDVKQELYLRTIEDFNKIDPKDLDKYNEGWWFQRLKWFSINLLKKENRDPINKSIRVKGFEGYDRK